MADMDLKGFKELKEAYAKIEENRNANAAALRAARQSNSSQAEKTSSGAGQGVGSARRAARGSSYKAPTAKPTPTAKPAASSAPAPAAKSAPAPAAKPQASAPKKAPVKQTGDKAKDMSTWAKANPKLAAKVKSKPAASGASKLGAAAAAAKPAAKPQSRLDKALSNIKPFQEEAEVSESAIDMPPANAPSASDPDPTKPFPKDREERAKKQAPKSTAPVKKEEAEVDSFDIILEYLTGRGFPEEDALQLMATMDDERREKITAEAVSWDKYGRPKTKEGKAKAARAQAEMRAKDKASGRRPYGSKMGYARKENDE